jgi:hypothetical protein
MMILYHATNRAAADAIMRDQRLKAGTRGKLGPTIYFADTPDSARFKSQNGNDVVLAVEVEVGNTLDVTSEGRFTYEQLQMMGYNSVCLCEPCKNPVWAIFVPANTQFSHQTGTIRVVASF